MLVMIKASLRFIRDTKKPVVCTGFFYFGLTFKFRIRDFMLNKKAT